MTEEKESRKSDIKDIFTLHYFSRHFTPIMCLIAVIGLILIVFGGLTSNNIMVSISTALFSASTLGVIFKVLGYDVFILTIIRQIVYEKRFLERLRENELRAIIRETIAVMRGLPPKEEIYEVFEKYLLDDLVGIANYNRRFIITLRFHSFLGHKVVLGKITTTYDIFNESPKTQALFTVEGEEDVIFKGGVSIPECLKGSASPSLRDPTVFWDLQKDENGRYVGVCIDGRYIDAEKMVKYNEPDDYSKGLWYKIKCHEEIEPKSQPKHIELRHECIYDTHDYIVRTLGRYGKDIEVIIDKPKDMEVYVSWLLTAVGKEPKVKKEKPEKSSTSYIQKVEGVLVPGNGFIIMWWPKEKMHETEKIKGVTTSGSS